VRFDFEHEPMALWQGEPQTPDIKISSLEENFGCVGAPRIINTIFEDIPKNQAVWQPDVLWEAKSLAEAAGIKRIVDIGCGNGEKLVHYFDSAKFETVGVDFHGSLDLCRKEFPDRRWLECDLTSYDDLARIAEISQPDQPAIYVLSDVIEHLSDPRPLMASVRKALIASPHSRFVISTPDRSLLEYEDPNQRPANEAHLREWTVAELVHLFSSSGFKIERAGLTRANQFFTETTTILLVASCPPDHYFSFLKEQGLVHADVSPTTLLVTMEYAGYHRTGGIGSFVQEQRLAYGIDHTLCLFDEAAVAPDSALKQKLRLLGPEQFFNPDHLHHLPVEDRLLAAVRQLLFFFPGLHRIEYADYQGPGFRIAQAKRSGLLPESVAVVVHCHGTTHYLENGHRSWYGAQHSGVAEKEKIGIELADIVVYPTRFLQTLHEQSGINPKGQQILMRYPYSDVKKLEGLTRGADTLVFYGKRTDMKGYGLFLELVCNLVYPAKDNRFHAPQIRNILIIGPCGPVTPQDNVNLENIKGLCNVEEHANVGRDAAMRLLASLADRAICVMPYLADNHPYALLDTVFSGVLPVMVDAGGVGEMYPALVRPQLLAKADLASLRTTVKALFDQETVDLQALAQQTLSAFLEEQIAINQAVHDFGVSPRPWAAAAGLKPRSSVAAIVPVFNMPLGHIGELIYALNNQTYSLQEVIFIDDCSEEGYFTELKAFVDARMRLPYRILRHEFNRGLAATRNTGMQASSADYIVNVDADDIPLNDFVRDIVYSLDTNPEAAAAIPYLSAFTDGTDHHVTKPDGYVYRPLGDGVIASQVDNNLGHANSGYRRSALLACGGWDGSDRSMWEDYALYLRLASMGYRLQVIPKTGCLYRVRPNSMLRTYNVWPAMQRIARNMAGLPRFENFRLQSSMRHYAVVRHQLVEMQKQVEALQAHNEFLNANLQRRSVRAIRSLTDRMARYPVIFGTLRKTGLFFWKSARRIIRR
jgi:glycosyltransferase involved in cell wall biosynthesis/SAM-dependent methyltransferase